MSVQGRLIGISPTSPCPFVSRRLGDVTHPRNLGFFSSRTDLGHDWVIEPNVRLLLAERFGRAEGPEVLVSNEPAELGPRDFGLDLRPLGNRL